MNSRVQKQACLSLPATYHNIKKSMSTIRRRGLTQLFLIHHQSSSSSHYHRDF